VTAGLDHPRRNAPVLRRPSPRAPRGRRAGKSGYDPTLYQFLVLGQSNSNGTYTYQNYPDPEPVTTYPRSLRHLMPSQGVRLGLSPLPGTEAAVDPPITSFVPLCEIDDRYWSVSGTAGHGETIASSFAGELSRRAGGKTILVSNCGIDGTAYALMKKGTQPYRNGLSQVTAGYNYARQRGIPHRVYLLILHGYTDAAVFSATYVTDLPQWQIDFQQDIQAITGQQVPVLAFFSQQEYYQPAWQALVVVPVDVQQIQAWQANRRVLFLTGPQYLYQYCSDGIHQAPGSQRWHGAMIAKAAYRTLFGKGNWFPLHIRQATLSGSTITVNLNVPAPPLVIDKTLVLDANTVPVGSGATAASKLGAVSAVVVAGGTSGYAVNDTVTLTGGTFTQAVVLLVTGVSAGVITTVSVQTAGTYTVLPSNPVSQGSTSGVGAGVPTFTITWGVSSLVVTAGGVAYPAGTTVTFSGGAGSGATATPTMDANGTITSTAVTAAGTGYTSLPTVAFVSPTGVCGFTFLDDSGAAVTVTSVAVAASGVDLTVGLSGAPTGTPSTFVLHYGWGMNPAGSNNAGSFSHPARGNIRDSDPEVSIDGCPLYNWLLNCSQAVT
jgi:hypothetical protein